MLTAAEIARRAGVTDRRVWQWMHAHGRGRQMWGRLWLYSPDDATAFLSRERRPGRKRQIVADVKSPAATQ